MASFNKVILVGNLTATPELKQTNTGISVCSFSVAVGRKFAKGTEAVTDFFSVVAWRATAEFVAKYFAKGNPILVCGSLQNRSYTDSKGEKHTVTEVVADEVAFVAPKSGAAPAPGNYTPDAYMARTEEIDFPEDVPF